MEAAYSVADLVVARSGATPGAELCSAGKASVLIPLPSASNNEQHYNATYLKKHGAAVIVDNSEISEQLYPMVNKLILDKDKLQKMESSAISLAKPDASTMIADDIIRNMQ
jgi:UDP-N-acetylglucosamine--N-acetylmuramyl-(pentapeptide) pyrophosphoryl-undecaprenol N-acetylglucosamine transferase